MALAAVVVVMAVLVEVVDMSKVNISHSTSYLGVIGPLVIVALRCDEFVF